MLKTILTIVTSVFLSMVVTGTKFSSVPSNFKNFFGSTDEQEDA